MPAVTETLRNAQILAEFSNLEPDGVEYFRHNYPDFAPSRWWDYQSDLGKPQWQVSQERLRKRWQGQFADNLLDRVILTFSVFDPWDLIMHDTDFIPEFYHFDPDASKPSLIPLEDVNSKHYYPYHRAVFFLFEHPWRARFCVECNKRFVATGSQNIYCGEACSHVWHNRQKLKWYYKDGKRQRAAKQKKRTHPRLPKGPK
jgi:hypothetical protein